MRCSFANHVGSPSTRWSTWKQGSSMTYAFLPYARPGMTPQTVHCSGGSAAATSVGASGAGPTSSSIAAAASAASSLVRMVGFEGRPVFVRVVIWSNPRNFKGLSSCKRYVIPDRSLMA
eukprot:77131-Prymnesium_polylepis.1